MGKSCRVTIVDRNEIAREGLRRIVADRGFRVVTTCGRAEDLVDDPRHLVVVGSRALDEAIAVCRAVRAEHPEAHLVLLVDDCCTEVVMEALSAGVDGVLSRLMPVAPLVASLELIALGENVIPSSTVRDLSDMPRLPRPAASGEEDMYLSARELAVLDRIAAGRANKLISRDLGIAEGTVKVHVKSILRKLGVSNRTQAALWAAGRAAPRVLAPYVVAASAYGPS